MTKGRAEDIPRVYIDANVFILAYESRAREALHAFAILEAIEAGAIHGISSELTLGEVLPGALNADEPELADAYHRMLTDGPHLTILPVTRDVLINSAEIRVGREGFKLQDAIHCATALQAHCDFLVSDDKRIPKGLAFAVVRLGPNALADILGPVA